MNWKNAGAVSERHGYSMSTGFSLPPPEQITEKLLKRVDITEPPVRMDKVLSVWRNLHIIEDDLDGAGYLLPLGELGAEILVNRNNSDERRLFTIAHELGHWILGLICKKRTGEFRQPTELPKATIERWCDAFATNLLMPTQLVVSWLPPKDNPLLIDSILRASDIFKVSQEAFFIRIWELQRVQVVILKLQPTPSIERSYADSSCSKDLAKVLDEANVHQQLQMAGSMIYFTLRSAAGRVSVSGKKLGGGRAVLAVAWPHSV